jgi:hypothetical protein
MKFPTGTLLSTPQNGAFEYDGAHLYFTIQDVRHQLVMAPVTANQESSISQLTTPVERSAEDSVGNNQESLKAPLITPEEGAETAKQEVSGSSLAEQKV